MARGRDDAARLYRIAFDEVDGASEQALQRRFQIRESGEIVRADAVKVTRKSASLRSRWKSVPRRRADTSSRSTP
jgi:hypothetical protein